MFRFTEIAPGVKHIRDAMGVCFTLIEGGKSAALFDTGYGMEDVQAYVRTLTDKPVKVYLSHGHHDHMLGARWFGQTLLAEADMDEFRERSGEGQRRKVIAQAEGQGVPVPADFLNAPISLPEAIRFDGKTGPFDSLEEDLGGLKIRVIHVPGHTPGSIVFFVPEYSLLLTGDDWNPCTWMWFPESLSVVTWRKNMRAVLPAIEKETGAGISHVLCSHQPAPREGAELREYLDYMSDERLDSAPSVDMNSPVRTRQVTCPARDWVLVFDAAK